MIHIVSKIPMICPPKDWNNDGNNGGYLLDSLHNYVHIDKFIKSGKSSFQFSKNTIDTINLLQKKPYSISKLYLNYCKTEWFRDNNKCIKSSEEFLTSYQDYDNAQKLFLKIHYSSIILINEHLDNQNQQFFQIKNHINKYYKDLNLEIKYDKKDY